jgi:hypothetical protein
MDIMNSTNVQIFPTLSSEIPPATQEPAANPAISLPAAALARRFPRDEERARRRILQACRHPALAEAALCARAGSESQDLSLELAETLARQWGNLDFGIVELECGETEATAMAYAWDVETNTRRTRIFAQPARAAHSGEGSATAARCLRECLLGVIPGPLAAAATAECQRTLAAPAAETAPERAERLAAAFAEWGVSRAALERRLGLPLAEAPAPRLAALPPILAALREGSAQPGDFFLRAIRAAPPAEPAAPTSPAIEPAGGAGAPAARSGPAQSLPAMDAPAPASEVPIAFAPPAAEPRPAAPPVPPVAPARALARLAARCVKARLTEAQLLQWARAAGHIDASVTSLDELAARAPRLPRRFLRQFSAIAAAIAGRGL